MLIPLFLISGVRLKLTRRCTLKCSTCDPVRPLAFALLAGLPACLPACLPVVRYHGVNRAKGMTF
ncbi:hypothetical protein [Pantoea sp. OXWO6B1]|uniref:hypothetical protein n=1 Tax=Pantoea sp. OXWO6B1 TaxID=1835724 RepID=UPI0007C77B04|nr:hypothetical protein [Pantoea sp. OXWO6B1]OAE08502.1 hypothetical protein A6A26_13185 [Pantoea sp. OXWO6B1]